VDRFRRSIVRTDYRYLLTRVLDWLLLVVKLIDFLVSGAIENELDFALGAPEGAIFCGLVAFFLHHGAMSSVRSALVVHDFAGEGHWGVVLLLPDRTERNDAQQQY